MHRWLGIAIALLMAVWAGSGIVMMYVAFPETSWEERLAGLAPLDMRGCCAVDAGTQLGEGEITRAAVEMLDGRPVLRFADMDGAATIDLATGAAPQLDSQVATSIARDHLMRAGGQQPTFAVEEVDRDQWTVYSRFRQHHPLYKVSFEDQAGTQLYVSGTTGEVVQDTTAHERFWNWLGTVPHWLYFTSFREIQPLWYNFVVYSSLLGCFLTLTGLYIGIRQYRRTRASGKRSPYRGLMAWHHWTGLIFGVFTLTWVASGLLSMQPWGLFDREGAGAEAQALAGRPANKGDVALLLAALADNAPRGVVRAELAIQDLQPVALLSDSAGRSWRARLPALEEARPDMAELAARGRTARPGVPIASEELIREGDAYHYAHKTPVVLPAWRVIYDDEQRTRLYFDPRTGEGIRKVDAAGRAYRWLHYGLHRMDFTGLLRTRPVWDLVTLPLMAGVTLLCVIGCWAGWRRLTRRRRRPARAGKDAPSRALSRPAAPPGRQGA